MNHSQLHIYPLTPERWYDFETLFGARGACGGCWCMYWRLSRAEFDRHKGDGNKQSMQDLVSHGQVPGLLAYHDGVPAGWCAIAPREVFSTLERSRILKRLDAQPVWSIVCFFIAKLFRRQGLSVRLLKAAIDYAAENGATIIEGYPIEPKKTISPDLFAYTGLASTFRQVGFVQVARPSETRPIMRYYL